VQLQLGSGHDEPKRPEKSTRLTPKGFDGSDLAYPQHIGQRFNGSLVGTRDHAATTAVCRNNASTDSCNIRFSFRT